MKWAIGGGVGLAAAVLAVMLFVTAGAAAPTPGSGTALIPVVQKGALLNGVNVSTGADARTDLTTTGFRELLLLPYDDSANGALLVAVHPYLDDGTTLPTNTIVGGSGGFPVRVELMGLDKVRIQAFTNSSGQIPAKMSYFLSR